MLVTEYVAPFIWAAATGVVLLVTVVVRSAMQKGVGDIVDKKIEPLDKRVRKLERHKEHLQIVPEVEEQEQ